MFPKSFIAPIFVLALTYSANAHAGIELAIGVKGGLTRKDVQRPSGAKPCGNANINQTLDSSTPILANADGTFSPSVTNFNGGTDGSRLIQTVKVDASGTGGSFVAAKMVANGNPNPTSDATEQVTAQLPSGTTCSGGSGKDLCLVSLTTSAGFGNCVVVKQGPGGVNPASPQGRSAVFFPTGAAKGVNRRSPSPVNGGDPSPPAVSGNGVKGETGDVKKSENKNKKGKKKNNKNKGKNLNNKGKGKGKDGKNKGGKNKNKKPAGDTAGKVAARGMVHRRNWSSRS